MLFFFFLRCPIWTGWMLRLQGKVLGNQCERKPLGSLKKRVEALPILFSAFTSQWHSHSPGVLGRGFLSPDLG